MIDKGSVLSRRNMVMGAAAAAGGVFALGASANTTTWFRAAQKAGAQALGIELNPAGGIAHWRSMIGQDFTVETRSGTVYAKLAAVEALHDGGKARPLGLARDEAFCCVFDTGRQEAPAGAGTYDVAHAALGRTQLYMSCCKTPRRLEAVFN
jgi:Rieske Fe-S protein